MSRTTASMRQGSTARTAPCSHARSVRRSLAAEPVAGAAKPVRSRGAPTKWHTPIHCMPIGDRWCRQVPVWSHRRRRGTQLCSRLAAGRNASARSPTRRHHANLLAWQAHAVKRLRQTLLPYISVQRALPRPWVCGGLPQHGPARTGRWVNLPDKARHAWALASTKCRGQETRRFVPIPFSMQVPP